MTMKRKEKLANDGRLNLVLSPTDKHYITEFSEKLGISRGKLIMKAVRLYKKEYIRFIEETANRNTIDFDTIE